MSKQILIYEKLNDVKTLEKGRGEDGFMRLKGVFGECSKQKNRNGRIYVAENYKQMVDRIKQRIATEGVPGQLEHPNTMNIDYNEVSHVIEDINMDENGLVTGTVKLLNTPKGKIAQAIVEGGLPLFISSRATGNVDKNGVVTLENIQTYDLVGTPGFANARLNLAESFTKESGSEFISESFDDNFFIVESKDESSAAQANKENDFNMTEQEHKDLLDKIALLEDSVNKTNKRVDEVNSKEHWTKIAEAIQNWVINEYSPSMQNWILNEAVEGLQKTIAEGMSKSLAEGIQGWMLNEMAPELQGWMFNEMAPELQNWMQKELISEHKEEMVKEMANGIQGWMLEEVAPMITKWITEQYNPTLDKYMTEHFQPAIMEQMKNELATIKESKESKLASIDNILEMLDKNVKPLAPQHVMEHQVDPSEPLYIRQMPENVRPLWEAADDNMKEYVQRKARLYHLTNESAINNFWESIDWNKKVPAVNVYEGLDNIQDKYEAQLRARLRHHNS